VVSLAGINHVEGFVYDTATADLILVGSYEEGRAPLTLDDLVVALRARFRYNQWPLVSIDPTLETQKTQMQHVRFEGGVHETAFGQTMFDADYRLKQMGMGLVEPGIAGLKTYWDRSVEEMEAWIGAGQREVNSRFWFYPINPHVVVREGVCVVRGLKVGVFTEVLGAKIDGKPVEDLKGFKLEVADAFAKDVSDRFDELCRAQPSFNRLRGLQELVAVSKALEELGERPELSWWLERYPLEKVGTPKEVKVLRRRYESNRGWFEVSGGVHLTALAMRLNAGDVRALRDAVLNRRPSPDALTWRFIAAQWIIDIPPGQVKPEDIASLFQQAVFLYEQKRYEDAIALWDTILRSNPGNIQVLFNKGVTLIGMNEPQKAIAVYDEVIRRFGDAAEPGIREVVAKAMFNKGVTLGKMNRPHDEIAVYDEVIRRFGDAAVPGIREVAAKAMFNKGVGLYYLKRYQEARKAFEEASKLGAPDAPRALEMLRREGH